MMQGGGAPGKAPAQCTRQVAKRGWGSPGVTGMGGRALSAHATRHRQKINVQVVARYEGTEGHANLEEHTYRATIRNIPAGRYWVRVNHSCFAPALNIPAEGISPLEVSVQIDASDIQLVP